MGQATMDYTSANFTDLWNLTFPEMFDHYHPEKYIEWNIAISISHYLPPVLLIVGTILNALTLAVLNRKCLRSSTPVIYFKFLLIACTVALHVAVLPNWLNYLGFTEFSTLNPFTCKFYVYLSYFSTDMPAWILVACALHNVAGVICPEWMNKAFRRRYATMFIGLLAVLLFLANMPMAIVSKLFTWSSIEGVIRLCGSEVQGAMKAFIKHYWPWFDLAMFAALPFIILCITSLIFLSHILKIRKQRESSYFCHSANRMLPTVLGLSLSFIVMIFPICANILFVRFAARSSDPHLMAQIYLWYNVAIIFQEVNYASNFFFFLLSPNFRRELKGFLCTCLPAYQTETKLFPIPKENSTEKINKVFTAESEANYEVYV